MRYFLLLAVLICAMPVLGQNQNYNESVAAISFNPSRTGAYDFLKIVHKADIPGGIDVCSWNNSTNQCTSQTAVAIGGQGTVQVKQKTANPNKENKIETVSPKDNSSQKTLKTQNKALVRGAKQDEDSFTNLWKNNWGTSWNKNWHPQEVAPETVNAFKDYGTAITVIKGAKITAKSPEKAFIGTLNTPNTLTLDVEGQVISSKSINVQRLTLGKGTLPENKVFSWGDYDGRQVLIGQ